MHGYYVGVLTLQPVTLVGPAPDSRFAATSDLVVGKHGAEDSASQKALWHARVAASLFARHCLIRRRHSGMLELQPVYLLVTALGSRLAVAFCGRGTCSKLEPASK